MNTKANTSTNFRSSSSVFSYRRFISNAIASERISRVQHGRVLFVVVDIKAVLDRLEIPTTADRAPYGAALYIDSILVDTTLLRDPFEDSTTVSHRYITDMLRRSVMRTYLKRYAGQKLSDEQAVYLRETIKDRLFPEFACKQYDLPYQSDTERCWKFLMTSQLQVTAMAYQRTYKNKQYKIERSLSLNEHNDVFIKSHLTHHIGDHLLLSKEFREPADRVTEDSAIDKIAHRLIVSALAR